MTETRTYKPKAARKPLQFWLQPFLLLILIGLLWQQMPVSALLFNSRVVQPLPRAHVFYVNLEPVYAAEVIRASMQAWRMSAFGGGAEDDIAVGGIDPYEAPDAPKYLEHGLIYPGRWEPDDVSPLAQALPDLLYANRAAVKLNTAPAKLDMRGFRTFIGPKLKKMDFKFPLKKISALEGSGNCRAFVETDKDGSVVHVLVLQTAGKGAVEIERALTRGSAAGAASGEVRVLWRNSAK